MRQRRENEPANRAIVWLTGPLTPILLALLVYANTLGNGFTYDDNPIIAENPRVRSVFDIRGVWLTDWWATHADEEEFPSPHRDRLYRPLTLFSFALNYAVGGLAPIGYHLVNVLLHALVSGLVWKLAERWTRDRGVALLAGALFAVHPVHVEAVAGVVGRAEILSALFLCLGLLPLFNERVSTRALHASAAAFLAALLSKENAVCYPALAALVWFVARARLELDRRLTPRLALLSIPLLIYFPLRFIALEARFIRDAPSNTLFNPLVDADASGRILGAFSVLGHYARLLFAPVSLSCDYGLAIVDPFSTPGIICVVGVFAALALAGALIGLARTAGAWRIVAEASFAFLLSYVLISNTFLLIGVSLAERLIYWPSAPALIAISTALLTLLRRVSRGAVQRRYLPACVAAVILLSLGLRAFTRNSDWTDDKRLFAADLQTYPGSAHLNNSLAQILIYEAQHADNDALLEESLQRAARLLDRALQIHSRYPHALFQRGVVFAMQGNKAAALSYLDRALALSPSSRRTQAMIRELKGGVESQSAELTALYEAAMAAPDDPNAQLNLGEALLQFGDSAAALKSFDHATAINSRDARAHRGRGQALALLLREADAIDAFRAALEADPKDWQSHGNLAMLLAQRDPQAALTHAQKAVDLQPNDLRTQLNFAEALALNQRKIEALERFRLILRGLKPDDPFYRAINDRIRELDRD